MHICMIITSYKESTRTHTGAELQAETQLRALQQLGHTITVIAKKKTKQSRSTEVLDGVTVYRLWPTGLRSIRTALLIWQQRKKFDIVHLHGQHVFTAVAAAMCHLINLPSVMKITISGQVTAPTSFDKLFPKGLIPFRRLINLLSRQASAYITISKEIANELIECNFVPERIHRITNGVDMKRFHPLAAIERRNLRNQLGLPEDKMLVLFCSRLIHRKGFDLLLNTWPEVWKAHPDVHLIIVGDRNEEAEHKLQVLVNQTAATAITIFGQVPNAAPYMQAADIFVFPSRKEGLPNALIEAMSCGCACVASDISGNTDLIQPQNTGILFTSGEAAAFANQLNWLLQNRDHIAKLGHAAAAYMQENYDIRQVASKIEQLYKRISQ